MAAHTGWYRRRVFYNNVFGLGAVDPIAKNPAARATLGIHPFSAEAASATGGDTGDENFVAFVEAEDIHSQFLDNPDSLMTKDSAAGYGREVTSQNVKVCPADGGGSDPNDGVRCLHNRRPGPIFPGPATRPLVNKGLHTCRIVSVVCSSLHDSFSELVLGPNLRIGRLGFSPRYATLSWLPSPDEGPYDQWMQSYFEAAHSREQKAFQMPGSLGFKCVASAPFHIPIGDAAWAPGSAVAPNQKVTNPKTRH
jgi:hypothetical protein